MVNLDLTVKLANEMKLFYAVYVKISIVTLV